MCLSARPPRFQSNSYTVQSSGSAFAEASGLFRIQYCLLWLLSRLGTLLYLLNQGSPTSPRSTAGCTPFPVTHSLFGYGGSGRGRTCKARKGSLVFKTNAFADYWLALPYCRAEQSTSPHVLQINAPLPLYTQHTSFISGSYTRVIPPPRYLVLRVA